MRNRLMQFSAVVVLAAAMWAVPSVGTRGQGTLGDRFVHADRDIVGTGPAARAALGRADALAAAAVAGL